jgi:undecaprenyl-diphosphatase
LNILDAIVLGIIQGLTEFLPISSTGHLTVAGKLMNLISPDKPQEWTAFIAVIQLGTMAAILVYFWKDLIEILIHFWKENVNKRVNFGNQSFQSRTGWFIIVGTIPVVIIGLLFKKAIEGALTKDLYVIAINLIVFAVILAIAEIVGKRKKTEKDISLFDSLFIGIAQAFALIPGASRSGTTITGGLLRGLKREDAARFSFLLSLPAVLASGLLEMYQSLSILNSTMWINLIISTLAAGISGYLAIDFLLKYLRSHSTYLFIYYRIIAGAVILILIWYNIIQP